jgi:DNA-binding transcriptional MerR regulator
MTSHIAANPPSNVVWIEDESQPSVRAVSPHLAPEQAEFTIGELSREFGVTLRALRFYEAKGFISPRRVRNMRLYSQQDRARIAAILSGKKLGFSLADIRTMVADPEGARDAEGLKVTKEKCLEQIQALEKQQAQIKDALAELWRIHSGLSAEIIRIDRKERDEAVPQLAGVPA